MKKKTAKKAAPKTAVLKKGKDVGLTIIPKRAADVLSRDNADGTVAIMKLDNDRFFFTLSDMAAEVWKRMNGKTPLEVIKKELVKKFSPPETRFNRDVEKLLKDLKKEKLIAF